MKILIVGFYDTDISVMIRFLLQSELQKRGKQDIFVESVGVAQTCSGKPIEPEVIKVLSVRGVADHTIFEEYKARYFKEVKVTEFDFIVTTTGPIKGWVIFQAQEAEVPGAEAKTLVLGNKNVTFSSLNDRLTSEMLLQEYTKIAEAIERAIPQILQFIGITD